ncbi:hypothetical protein AZKH_1889 [Azoarcus sp. KH32C]|nr:hypothetical protein AZKH_1889 [Azoarcus sp. KH32C]
MLEKGVPAGTREGEIELRPIVRIKTDLAVGVGTAVELLDRYTVPVEFADDHGGTAQLVPAPVMLLENMRLATPIQWR